MVRIKRALSYANSKTVTTTNKGRQHKVWSQLREHFLSHDQQKIKYVVTIKCGRTERHYFLVDRVTEVTMDEACEPETKQGNTYRVMVDLKALSRSIKESTEPKHRVQR